jgi:hypothetical protein
MNPVLFLISGISNQGAVMKISDDYWGRRPKGVGLMGFGLLALTLIAAWALAHPIEAMADEKKSVIAGPDAYTVKLEKDLKVPGAKVAYLEGNTDADGLYLELKDLWITQPVRIVLLAKTAQDDLRIQFRKYHWKKPSQQCATKTKGYCTFLFKTQGDVGMKVLSPQGMRPFRLEVWVGPEVKPDLKPVVVHRKKD